MRFRFGRVSTGSDEDIMIEVKDLEELLGLCRKEEKAIIINDNRWRNIRLTEKTEPDWALLVYDDHIE